MGVFVGGTEVGCEPGVAVGLLEGDEVGDGTGDEVEVGGSKVAVGCTVMVGGARVTVPTGVKVGWTGGVTELIGVGELLVAVLFTVGTGGVVGAPGAAAGRVASGRAGGGPDLGVGVGVAGKREMVKLGISSTPTGVTCSPAISVAAWAAISGSSAAN